MRVCLLTGRPDAAEYYTEKLRELGVGRVVVSPTVEELFDAMTEKPVSGVATDIPSLVRSTEQGKQMISDISEIFPLIRVNWAPGRELRAMGNRFVPAGDTPLKSFVQACRTFPPRCMRRQERVNRVVNLRWRPADETVSEAVRGFTLDVSQGGCFVCAMDPPPPGSMVRLEFMDKDIAGPIDVKVTWAIRWGEAPRAPGFGCFYLDRKGPTR